MRSIPPGGIDEQTLGNGVVNDFAYNPVSNRLDRILTAKPGYLALVDLSPAALSGRDGGRARP
ncbi:MAG: hypothetical protein JXB07_15975 [Anaerolineae bacterium]|nr:hypothetical protein [Anaerolineae bacterium]